jgi:hypothetical protein
VIGMVAFKTLMATGLSRLVKFFATIETRAAGPRRKVR